MIFAEPPRSPYDVRFSLLGFPVRIHPYFWVIALLLGYNREGTPPKELLAWVVVMLVSIVIHELGHALLQRRYGGEPRIVLHSFGGLAITDHIDWSPRRQILISLAGPAAGFLFAVVVLAILLLTGHGVGLQAGREFNIEGTSLTQGYALPLFIANLYWEPPTSSLARTLAWDLLAVNIYWGLLNLMPIYPLDGGQVSREVCTLSSPSRGIVLSLQISIAAAALVALFAITRHRLFMGLMFGYLAYTNYQTLQRYQGNRW